VPPAATRVPDFARPDRASGPRPFRRRVDGVCVGSSGLRAVFPVPMAFLFIFCGSGGQGTRFLLLGDAGEVGPPPSPPALPPNPPPEVFPVALASEPSRLCPERASDAVTVASLASQVPGSAQSAGRSSDCRRDDNDRECSCRPSYGEGIRCSVAFSTV
jgi:hypothetical protein